MGKDGRFTTSEEVATYGARLFSRLGASRHDASSTAAWSLWEQGVVEQFDKIVSCSP